MRLEIRILAPVAIALLLAAWYVNAFNSFFFGTHLKWTESVSLSSGREIRVQREVKYGRTTGLGGPVSGRLWEYSSIRSLESPAAFPELSVPMTLLYVDQDADGRWWIIASTEDSDFWIANLIPSPPYWAFALKGDRWVLSSIPDAFWGRESNLLLDIRDDDWNTTVQREATNRKRALRTTIKVFVGHKSISREQWTGFKPGSVSGARSVPRDLKPFLE